MKDVRFKLTQTRNLWEDVAVMIHRFVCRIMRPGWEDPLLNIARKAKMPVATLREIYYGRRPSVTVDQVGKIQWACEEVLAKAKGAKAI